jgi:hypothetical protein
MGRRSAAVPLALAALAAGCGGGGSGTSTTAGSAAAETPDAAARTLSPAGARVLFVASTGSGWAVAGYLRSGKATARVLRLAAGRWRVAPRATTVRVRPLGPHPGSTLPAGKQQIAAAFSALVEIREAGLWLDGNAIVAQTAGTANRYTAYGATPALRPGLHSVVAFAEAGGSATAVAWTFRVHSGSRP